ncbi:MAG: biopolymer transport protein ExbB [Gammaproteobacteria bacterium]|jgi:biopolymer transport protein ExbB
MNNATLLPEVDEIESLWLEMLREMTESARVVKFNSAVISPGGETSNRDIVRIGSFNLISKDKYLGYSAVSKTVSELGRQPSANHLRALPLLFSGTSNYVRVGIDPTGPTGGNYLAALVDSPSLSERWHQGGIVGYIISGIGGLAALIVVWRLLVLTFIQGSILRLLKRGGIQGQSKARNALGRILTIHKEQPDLDADTLEAKLSEAIIKERPAIEKLLPLLKIIAMVAPLLGLLGTVAGMIITFQAITIFGAGDPKAMAGGISSALVTTVLGLLVAIPTVFAHSILNSKAQNILHILEHQSMGLIALHTQNTAQLKAEEKQVPA